MNPNKKPVFPPPLKFGQPEKPNWRNRILFMVFVMLAVGGIIAMLVNNPREKRLNCRSSVPTSLTGFGSCTEE